MGGTIRLVKLTIFTTLHAMFSATVATLLGRLQGLTAPGSDAAALLGRIGDLLFVALFFPMAVGDRLGIAWLTPWTPMFYVMNSLIWMSIVYAIPSMILGRLKGSARGKTGRFRR